MSEKISLREIIGAILSEIKAILKAYMNEAETAVKKRTQKTYNHKHSWQCFDGSGNFISWFSFPVHTYRFVQVP